MDDPQLVQVLDAVYNLLEEATRVLLLDSVVFDNVVEQLAPTCIFHYEVELLGGFYNLLYETCLTS